MLKFKKGVDPLGARPELFEALRAAHEAARRFGVTCVVTSIKDGNHGAGSKHYQGLAFDLRTRHLGSVTPADFARTIISALGAFAWRYDVVVEPTHIHIEYDPKVDGLHLLDLISLALPEGVVIS